MDRCDEVYNSATDLEEDIGLVRSRSGSRSTTPPPLGSQQDATAPRTILLGLWPGARQSQTDYYVDGYQSLYPSASIVMLRHSRTSTRHIDEALNHEAFDLGEKLRSPSQDILIHLFGDDAAVQVCRLLRAYRARTDLRMPVKSIILDSIPVVIAPTLRSLRTAPEQIFIFLYFAIIATIWKLSSVLILWFLEPYGDQVQWDLHDSKLLPATARKSYIFPERNVMWAWDRLIGVEEDEVLERQEFEVKRKKVDQPDFWSGDQERYWLGIENAWEGR